MSKGIKNKVRPEPELRLPLRVSYKVVDGIQEYHIRDAQHLLIATINPFIQSYDDKADLKVARMIVNTMNEKLFKPKTLVK